ncbi:MAG: hypothetical protein ACRC1H_12255, partial [Caldilineaceae bacterium]
EPSSAARPEPPPPPPGLIERGLTAIVGAGVMVAAVPFRMARPVVMSRVLAPAREAANHVVSIVVDATASIVAERLEHNPEAAKLVAAYTDRLLRALSNDPLTAALVRVQAEQFVAHVEKNPAVVGSMVDAIAERTMIMLARNPAALHALARVVANDYVSYLERNPDRLAGAADGYIQLLADQPEKLDALVQNVAVRFLASVERDPEPVESVVQLVGDRYMDHLNQNPDSVQELLAGQSADIATEIVGEVRERTVSFDARIEQIVRNILRLKPRADKQVAAEPAPLLRTGTEGQP